MLCNIYTCSFYKSNIYQKRHQILSIARKRKITEKKRTFASQLNYRTMAGIYIHIPFCKTRCIYCDFYSTTRSELKSRYIHALCKELQMRKEYLRGEPVETVYFGGGTPHSLQKKISGKSLKPSGNITVWNTAGKSPLKPILTI